MSKIEILEGLIDVKALKYLVVKQQRFEYAASLRDMEKILLDEYENRYGQLDYSSDLKKLLNAAKAEYRDEQIEEILKLC